MTSSISPLVAMQGTLEKMADKFTEALPRQMDVNKFISVAKLTLNKNPKLLQADKTSLMQTFMKAAQDGLYLDGKEAAAVQYGQSVQYIPMVEGIIKVLHNSGLIKTISAEVVYENDLFDYELGTAPKITHKPLITGDRGKPICVYAVAITTNEGEYYEVMNMTDIEKCRQVSKASASPHSPWVKWFDQMAKKTVIHRIAKRLPKNDAINSVVRIDEDTDFKQAVNVTPTPDKQEQPLSRLKEAMGMANEEVDQAANEVINNYRKEE
jgi:recombination protein RecT